MNINVLFIRLLVPCSSLNLSEMVNCVIVYYYTGAIETLDEDLTKFTQRMEKKLEWVENKIDEGFAAKKEKDWEERQDSDGEEEKYSDSNSAEKDVSDSAEEEEFY